MAAALLAPTLTRMEQTNTNDLAQWSDEFVAWSLIDPRAAFARLEKIPVAQDTNIPGGSNSARFAVGAVPRPIPLTAMACETRRTRDRIWWKTGSLRAPRRQDFRRFHFTDEIEHSRIRPGVGSSCV